MTNNVLDMSILTNYLYECRWCNFKEEIRQGRVTGFSLETMPYDKGKKLFVLGTVNFTEGESRYFSMPLARKVAMPQEQNVLVMDGEIYTDAALEPDFWASLMQMMEEHQGSVRFNNGWTLENWDIGHSSDIAPCKEDTSRALSVEQSNTTINVGGGKLAFKLERMLEFSNEVNSEFEMNEKLMRENCSVMPKTFGGFIWRRPDGSRASSGIIQEFVKNKGDMWNYAMEYLDKKLKQAFLTGRGLTPAENEEFIALVRNLSAKTAEMSECLTREDSNPNFTPEKVTDGFIHSYQKQMQTLLKKTKQQIRDNLDRLPEPSRSQATRLLAGWDENTSRFVNERITQLMQAEDKGTLNRVHGDFHLGQVMVTPDNDLRFIDFAGEPDLPMEQRKQKHIYVRDIAGMYRSLKGYMGAVAVENFAASAQDVASAEERKAWAQKAVSPLIDRVSREFLGDKSLNEPWLSLEILRKNLYEVNYEMGNRPNMAYVPISGLVDLLNHTPSAANQNIKSNNDLAM